jgi:signal transduction histidine kinase
MNIASQVVKVFCLVLLLTWFSLRALNPEAELFDRALAELDHFETVESMLYRDLLMARAGMLRNYDPLVREVKALQASLVQLRENAGVDAQTRAALDRLAGSLTRQEDLVEKFKSDNALLHNSLSFVGRFDTRSLTPDLGFAINAASAAILHLTLDTSSSVVQDVELRLDELDQQSTHSGEHDLAEPLLAHGRLLQQLLPSVDSTLTAIHTLSQQQGRSALRGLIVQRQVASRRSARTFRKLLYVTSLLLVVFMIDLGIRLRSRAKAMQQRAMLEHLIARISMRLVDAQPRELDAEIDRAISDLADHVGSDRVYLVMSSPSERSHLWYRRSMRPPPGWPAKALELAARIGTDPDGAIYIPSVKRFPAREIRNELDALGLGGWVCVTSTDRQGRTTALGFDTIGAASRISNVGELALLRMALDTFVHAMERHATNTERKRLETRLAQACRMEKIGTFTSGIAHNFNNILGGILGHSEIMEDQVGSNPRLLGHLAGIRRSAERARDLVNQLLVFGRRRDMRGKPVSIGAMIAETASLLRVSLPANIDLAIRQSPASAIVFGENAQLQQVILNLCNNAAHALEGGGRIEVSTELRYISAPISLTHREISRGQYVCITVSDNGHGMEESTLERLFEPFFTTRSSGNGLGLATVQEIVHDHGGGMSVQSKPGEGSRFEVWLPLVTSSRSDPKAAAPSMGNGEIVMIVGGNRKCVLNHEEMLAALGYEAVGFTTAEAALAACRADPDRFDMIVVGQLGTLARSLELATELHSIMPRVSKILAVNTALEISADALLAAGISDVIRWPITAEEIAVTLAHSRTLDADALHQARQSVSSITLPRTVPPSRALTYPS